MELGIQCGGNQSSCQTHSGSELSKLLGTQYVEIDLVIELAIGKAAEHSTCGNWPWSWAYRVRGSKRCWDLRRSRAWPKYWRDFLALRFWYSSRDIDPVTGRLKNSFVILGLSRDIYGLPYLSKRAGAPSASKKHCEGWRTFCHICVTWSIHLLVCTHSSIPSSKNRNITVLEVLHSGNNTINCYNFHLWVSRILYLKLMWLNNNNVFFSTTRLLSIFKYIIKFN